jgi:hypothetical protein
VARPDATSPLITTVDLRRFPHLTRPVRHWPRVFRQSSWEELESRPQCGRFRLKPVRQSVDSSVPRYREEARNSLGRASLRASRPWKEARMEPRPPQLQRADCGKRLGWSVALTNSSLSDASPATTRRSRIQPIGSWGIRRDGDTGRERHDCVRPPWPGRGPDRLLRSRPIRSAADRGGRMPGRR